MRGRLAFKRPIADFITLVEEDPTLELVSSFAFVQAALATSTQRRAGIPLDHEEGPLDATEFAKGSRKPALLRDAESFFRIVDGTTDRAVIDAAR
ncbi:hypothetical protein RHIZO_00706 [Rhizobiaceae bacterium]|nr:hypothetical protein RHIZO_00706 [Rhizobiaceae bacterium]